MCASILSVYRQSSDFSQETPSFKNDVQIGSFAVLCLHAEAT